MPLQIRRGTSAEKDAMSQKLASGELLWVTDEKKLYVGDGVTASSALSSVTGFTAEEAQDAVVSMFNNGTHSGITFTYNDNSNSFSAKVDTTALEGTIAADGFIGNLYANDSTLSFNAATGVFNGNLTGNVTGYLLGDIKGSVFSDDSTVMVDAVGITINTTAITSPTNELNVGEPENPLLVNVYSTANPFNLGPLSSIHGITDNSYAPGVNINISNGSFTSPTEASGLLGFQGALNFNTWVGGTYVPQTSFISRNSIDSNFLSQFPGGDLVLQVSNNSEYNYYTFNHDGVFTTPSLQVFSYVNGLSYTGEVFSITNNRPEPTPNSTNTLVGTIIFDSDLDTFKGYTNDSDGAGTPGFHRIQTGTPVAQTYTIATEPVQAEFTGSIADVGVFPNAVPTLSVTAITTGYVRVGMAVTGAGVAPNTFIIADLGGGDYRVNNSQTVGPITMFGPAVTPGTIIFVSDATSGSKFQGWDGTSWVSLG